MKQNQNEKPAQTKPGYYNQNDEAQTTNPQQDQSWPRRGNQQDDGQHEMPSPDRVERTDTPRREDDVPLD